MRPQPAPTPTSVAQPREYLIYDRDGSPAIVPLLMATTRVGRGLRADLRFDDATVSPTHALIVRAPDGTRLLDDRSLNGVFVNGERINRRLLRDGDAILIGRQWLHFVRLEPTHAAP